MKSKIILFMPSVDSGGVEKNFFLISDYLAKKCNDIVVISISKRIKKFLNKNIELVTLNFNFWDKMSRRVKFILGLFLLISEIKKSKNTTVISFQGNIYCGLLSRLLGFKLIIRSNSSPYGWSKNFFKNFLYKVGLDGAQTIIVNSYEFKKLLKKRFKIKAECIYNPLNKKEIIKLSKKKIKFNFFNKDQLNIINVGRLEDQKDQKTLLRAIKLIDKKIKIKLLIIGNGSKLKGLNNFIYKNNLKKSVKILNNISNPFPYIVRSDLFVLTSIFEGLPNVLLEAITLNKFVISTNCSTGPSEILCNGKGGILVPIKNYKKLANKIIFFNENKRKLKKKLFFAKNNLDRFEINRNLKSYLKVLNLD